MVRHADEVSIVSRCSRLEVKGKGVTFTLHKVMQRSLKEVELVSSVKTGERGGNMESGCGGVER